ncbi:bromodomain-containing protein [Rhizophagus irregularis DAOM 181602=DAOM 197198]|nr:bromodomain-containing protein [Rhizophagus irregularis DAOM 181602=DAOM 197198]
MNKCYILYAMCVYFLFCKVWVTLKTGRGHLIRITGFVTFTTCKELQIFWQEIIKKYDISETSQSDLTKKKQEVIKKNLILTEISQPNTSLPKKQTSKEFENDIYLIFCNCYKYNDVESEIYSLDKALECIFNKNVILQDRQTRELKKVLEKTNSNFRIK